jgi:hypothetical protein
MTPEMVDFLTEFDDLTDDVSRSKYEYFSSNLRRWLSLLDNSTEISNLVKHLEGQVNFNHWRREGLVQSSGMGTGRIVLPEQGEQRLGIQIGLFRWLATGDFEPHQFAIQYVSTEGNFNDIILELGEHFFEPFARDLRRYIERNLVSMEVPASDRTVSPDHNSADYKDAIEAIEKTEKAIREANDYPDDDDKEQRIAELDAGRVLFEARRFRVQALKETLLECLKYLSKKFMDKTIGIAAGAAIAALVSWLL